MALNSTLSSSMSSSSRLAADDLAALDAVLLFFFLEPPAALLVLVEAALGADELPLADFIDALEILGFFALDLVPPGAR